MERSGPRDGSRLQISAADRTRDLDQDLRLVDRDTVKATEPGTYSSARLNVPGIGADRCMICFVFNCYSLSLCHRSRLAA